MSRRTGLSLLLTVSAFVGLAPLAIAADVQSPEQVKNALRTLAYVQQDMASKLPTKSYNRLPHENQELQEAAEPMRLAVTNEPPAFKAKVEAQLKTALAAGTAVAAVSASNDEAKITAAIQSVADALKSLYALFPEPLRPVPGQLGSGPGRGPGPPPGLR